MKQENKYPSSRKASLFQVWITKEGEIRVVSSKKGAVLRSSNMNTEACYKNKQ